MASGSQVDAKIVLLGKEYGGKTSLVERFLHDRFGDGVPYQNTIGAAFGAKKITVGGESLTLGIWDTAGSERYEAMSRMYYRGAKAALLCIDLTDHSSFERANFWVNELKTCQESCNVYLVGTKADLVETDKKKRKVDKNDMQDFADEIKAMFYETSSKTGQNVEKLFQQIAKDCLRSVGSTGRTLNPSKKFTVKMDADQEKACTCS